MNKNNETDKQKKLIGEGIKWLYEQNWWTRASIKLPKEVE